MSRSTITAGGWRKVMDYQGAKFFQNVGNPEVFMRLRRRADGSDETRYAWDGDGIVTPSLTDVDRAVRAERGALT